MNTIIREQLNLVEEIKEDLEEIGCPKHIQIKLEALIENEKELVHLLLLKKKEWKQ